MGGEAGHGAVIAAAFFLGLVVGGTIGATIMAMVHLAAARDALNDEEQHFHEIHRRQRELGLS